MENLTYPPCYYPLPPEVTANLTITVHQKISNLLNGPLSCAVILQGLVLNALGLGAFMSHIKPRPSIFHYLIALSCWDMCLLTFAGLMYAFPIILFGNQLNSSAYIPTYPWSYYLAGVTLVGCVWTITALTLDRYLALCHPFTHRPIKKKSVVKLLVGVAIAACIYSSPRLFEIEVNKCINLATGALQNDLGITNLKVNRVYRVMYKIVGGFLFYSLVPYLLLLGLTLRISFQLSHTHSQPVTSPEDSTKARIDSSNRIMLAVIIKFLLCYLLTTVLDIWETVENEADFLNNSLVTLIVDFSNFLVALNSGTNFWTYVASSTFFRRGCARVLRCKWGREKYTLRAAGVHLTDMLESSHAIVHSRGFSPTEPRSPSGVHSEMTLTAPKLKLYKRWSLRERLSVV